MNRKDLLAFTLVGPPWDYMELNPLAVLYLDNPLYILLSFRTYEIQMCPDCRSPVFLNFYHSVTHVFFPDPLPFMNRPFAQC